MASEFWFFSQLHRMGYKAYITLGNTKSVDITTELSDGTLLTFDVKGKKSFNSGTYQYLPKSEKDKNHYLVFVGLEVKEEQGNFINFTGEPECYIVNSNNLNSFAFEWISRKKTSSGYGFDQNIFRILNKYEDETDLMEKGERRRLNKHKNNHKIEALPFKDLKEKFLSLQEFEEQFHSRK